jgi:WD40 repeat protein
MQRTCQGCHQPAVKQGDLDLTTFERLMTGGLHGKTVVAGEPAQSYLIAKLTGDAKPQMPLGLDPLPVAQIELVRRWVAEGAKDDTPEVAKNIQTPGKPPVYRAAPVITSLAYSPDGSILAVSGYREVLLHKSDGSGLLARLGGISDRIQSLAFSPDGTLLGVAGGTPANFGEVQIWDVAKRELRRSITLTSDTLFGVSFSPDGTKLAVGGADNGIHIIEVATGKELRKVTHHDGWVFGTVFSVDGTQIVSVSRDRAAKLTEVSTGTFLENINPLKGQLSAIARHPRRDVVVVGGEESIPYLLMMHRPRSLIIGDTSTVIREFEKQDGEIISVAFSPDGEMIAVGGAADEIHVYKVETGERVAALKGYEGGIYSLVFRPTGGQLAAGGFDGKVRIYDLKSGETAKTFVPVPLEQPLASIK